MDEPDLDIAVNEVPDGIVLTVDGDLDHRTSVQLARRAADILTTRRPRRLHVDLAGVSHFGSGAVAAMIAIHTAATRLNVPVEFTRVPDFARRIIAISGVDDFLGIRPGTT